MLEVELTEIQKRFGMPVQLPYDSATSKIVTPQLSRRQLLPLPSSVSSQLSDTDTSDLNSPDDKDKTDTVERKLPLRMPVKEELDQAIPSHSLLDNSAGKSKAELASRGGLANRQLPKRSGGLSNSSSLPGRIGAAQVLSITVSRMDIRVVVKYIPKKQDEVLQAQNTMSKRISRIK
ncbi:hypothetical protein TSAR_009477 [Trichomalopsis sarcophagae]|uniref:Uncharacterized protein n=1 Tax=Trichomalopsis sarcophagae TaxID=543379 RepID=A0A232FHK9_9HYME|nr:hypothetical protein TSAR_009477 [Trichomalopsis sarcophagae]